MCGIAGLWTKTLGDNVGSDIVTRMCDRLQRRGPDGFGIWNNCSGLTLGHRRLAILDLSSGGHQPKHSNSGRYVVTYNGEIYNFKSLRSDLQQLGHSFFSSSDTEVLLQGIEQWGIEATLTRLEGQFACAVWDKSANCLCLARDRIGEKPLYYGLVGEDFMFASELSALKVHPNWNGAVEDEALEEYLRFGYVPAPWSIYKGIFKLMPGHFLYLEHPSQNIVPLPYWNLKNAIDSSNKFSGTFQEASTLLETKLHASIGRQMIADVPLGAFLSGGIDSSLIVALMQQQASKPVRTFSIGFTEPQYNEAHHAKVVAKHLHTDHQELYVTPADAQQVVPLLPNLYDEPIGDSSQIPTYLVAKLAKSHVSVSLSGDGGDELFGGYTRYLSTRAFLEKVEKLPAIARQGLSKGIQKISSESWKVVFRMVQSVFGRHFLYQQPEEKILTLARMLTCEHVTEMYRFIMSSWEDPNSVVVSRGHHSGKGNGYSTQHFDPWKTSLEKMDLSQWMMMVDVLTYLPGDVLAKVDRASMGVSLESRAPFLSQEVVEFAMQLPINYKIQGPSGKIILKDILYRHVPKHLVDRPKMGFGIPVDQWIRGPLREWAEDLLSSSAINESGYLKEVLIRQKWEEHLSGKRNWIGKLWPVLMFQAWIYSQKRDNFRCA